LKLRNIGGIIIIDFIDMDSEKDQLIILERLNSAFKDDPSRPQVVEISMDSDKCFSQLGLV
tara:strand:+ start:229 stop:411 length:183 start_codon:yes stop_codon:yes gene_type:complete